jgi:hypothetical protein
MLVSPRRSVYDPDRHFAPLWKPAFNRAWTGASEGLLELPKRLCCLPVGGWAGSA